MNYLINPNNRRSRVEFEKRFIKPVEEKGVTKSRQKWKTQAKNKKISKRLEINLPDFDKDYLFALSIFEYEKFNNTPSRRINGFPKADICKYKRCYYLKWWGN